MKTRKPYQSPAVIKEVKMELEQALLVGSKVEERLEIETAGHKAEDHDFDESGFNTEWK